MIVLLINTKFFNHDQKLVTATSITYQTDPRTATLMMHSAKEHNKNQRGKPGATSEIDIIQLANTNT